MSGHEECCEGIHHQASTFYPEKYLGHSLVEDHKDRIISDLVVALLFYAGKMPELPVRLSTALDLVRMQVKVFKISDNNGVEFTVRDEAIARKVLREYNLIE